MTARVAWGRAPRLPLSGFRLAPGANHVITRVQSTRAALRGAPNVEAR